MQTKHNSDPTRAELLAFLRTSYRQATCGETPCPEGACPDGCCCEFDIEAAAYYVALHGHGGQWSNLYEAQCSSPFRPAPGGDVLPDWEEWTIATELYALALEWIGLPDASEEVYALLDHAYDRGDQ